MKCLKPVKQASKGVNPKSNETTIVHQQIDEIEELAEIGEPCPEISNSNVMSEQFSPINSSMNTRFNNQEHTLK